MNPCKSPFVQCMALIIASTSLPGTSYGQQRPLLTFTAGEVGIGDSLSEPLRFGASYRFRPQTSWQIAPAIGAAFAENGASFVYVDLERDFRLGQNWFVTPSFGIGSFDDGEDLNLGSELEFRSGLGLSREFYGQYPVGLAVYHLSNGGIADRNPGTESLVLSVHIPM